MAKRAIRPIRIEGNIAYVPLTQGMEAIVDAEDAHLVSGHNWFAYKGGNTFYARRNMPRSGSKRQTLMMHRAIVTAPDGFEVDHIDGDGLNNTRTNLRVATHFENMRNTRAHKNNKSGIKGVSWNKRDKKWYAHILLDGKTKHLGLFESKDKAAEAYAKASAEFHGAFGRVK